MKEKSNIPAIGISLLVTILFIGSAFIGFSVFDSIELKFYDFAMQYNLKQSDTLQDIAIIELDDESISKMGRWPLSRAFFAELIKILSSAKAKVIGMYFIFSEKEENSALREIRTIKDTFYNTLSETEDKNLQALLNYLEETDVRIDNDTRLVESVSTAGNVIFPIYFNISKSFFIKSGSDSEINIKNILSLDNTNNNNNNLFFPICALSATMPFGSLINASAGMGHSNLLYDVDGHIRQNILAIKYQEKFYPSFALSIVQNYLEIPQNEIVVLPSSGIRLKDMTIPTDQALRIQIRLSSQQVSTVSTYSFYDVLQKTVPPSVFKDKIVLVGKTSSLNEQTSGNDKFTDIPIVHVAQVIDNILHKTLITKPEWAFKIEIGIMILGGILLIIVSHMRIFGSLVLIFLYGMTLTLACLYVLGTEGFWIRWTYASCHIIIGYLAILPTFFFYKKKKSSHKIIKDVTAENTLQEVGHYRIDEELDEGLFGSVYKGTNKEDGQTVMIKTFKREDNLAVNLEAVTHETEKLLQLNHSNIVKILDFGLHEDLWYFVMEFIQDNVFQDYYVKGKLLPFKTVIEFMIKVCDALSYAHERSVVHGGLNPNSIILMKNDVVKVTDFGISHLAKYLGRQKSTYFRSPSYMAPEQVERKDIDQRTDIFSLGVLFFHLITGELPFKGDTVAKLMYQICNDPHPSVKTFNPKLPTACDQIINKALEKDVSKRYQTVVAIKKHFITVKNKLEESLAQKTK